MKSITRKVNRTAACSHFSPRHILTVPLRAQSRPGAQGEPVGSHAQGEVGTDAPPGNPVLLLSSRFTQGPARLLLQGHPHLALCPRGPCWKDPEAGPAGRWVSSHHVFYKRNQGVLLDRGRDGWSTGWIQAPVLPFPGRVAVRRAWPGLLGPQAHPPGNAGMGPSTDGTARKVTPRRQSWGPCPEGSGSPPEVVGTIMVTAEQAEDGLVKPRPWEGHCHASPSLGWRVHGGVFPSLISVKVTSQGFGAGSRVPGRGSLSPNLHSASQG